LNSYSSEFLVLSFWFLVSGGQQQRELSKEWQFCVLGISRFDFSGPFSWNNIPG